MFKSGFASVIRKVTSISMFLGFFLFATTANAQIELDFHSLPSSQGWTYYTSIGTPENAVFSVDGTSLHQNSFGIFDDPKYIWQGTLPHAPFDLQFRARITDVEGTYPDARSFSVLIGLEDFFIYVGLGPNFLEIEENLSGVQALFLDTSVFHDYRLMGDPIAGTYRFFVDGTEFLSKDIGHLALGDNFLMIGDRLLGINDSPAGVKADLSLFVFDSDSDIDIGPPTDKEECKNGGWRKFTIPRRFKNQGDCIQFVNTGK